MSVQTKRLSKYTGAGALIVAALFASAGVSAQQLVIPLQLSFSDPGARSMGLGGAFVALADDATAAFANPAGLAQLLKPEISIEARSWQHSIPFTVGGRIEGLPSGNGIDDTVGLEFGRSEANINGLSFFSLAYPREKVSFAFFRHQYANLEFRSETQGLFGGGTECCQIREFDQRGTSDVDVLSYGLAASYRMSDRLSIGVGLVYNDLALKATVTQFAPDDDTLQSIFSPNSYLSERSVIAQNSHMNDSDWSATGGFLWKLSDSWTVGGVYRQGPEVGIHTELRAGEAVDFGVPPGELLYQASDEPVEFPDMYGLGLAYRGRDDRLTVSFQWNRVEYADIPRSLNLDDQTIDDTVELHLGVEYVFLESTPVIAVRFGTWFEPDHQMRAIADEPLLQALLPRGDDEFHYAVGLGLAAERFQIDLALDFADLVDTLSLSAIYNF